MEFQFSEKDLRSTLTGTVSNNSQRTFCVFDNCWFEFSSVFQAKVFNLRQDFQLQILSHSSFVNIQTFKDFSAVELFPLSVFNKNYYLFIRVRGCACFQCKM